MLEYASRWAEALGDSDDAMSDLPVVLDGGMTYPDLLEERPLRAYHCTRLLPHEAEGIRAEGMRRLSTELVTDRLAAARAAGFISAEVERSLLDGYAGDEHGLRTGQVCAIVGRSVLDDVSGVWRLLSTWGGEAIYLKQEKSPLVDQLRGLGTPSIVALDLDLSTDDVPHLYFPDLCKVIVAAYRGQSDIGGAVFYRRDVPAHAIVDIWQPGDSNYDLHTGLPGLDTAAHE